MKYFSLHFLAHILEEYLSNKFDENGHCNSNEKRSLVRHLVHWPVKFEISQRSCLYVHAHKLHDGLFIKHGQKDITTHQT